METHTVYTEDVAYTPFHPEAVSFRDLISAIISIIYKIIFDYQNSILTCK